MCVLFALFTCLQINLLPFLHLFTSPLYLINPDLLTVIPTNKDTYAATTSCHRCKLLYPISKRI